jgi:hypothetical protein
MQRIHPILHDDTKGFNDEPDPEGQKLREIQHDAQQSECAHPVMAQTSRNDPNEATPVVHGNLSGSRQQQHAETTPPVCNDVNDTIVESSVADMLNSAEQEEPSVAASALRMESALSLGELPATTQQPSSSLVNVHTLAPDSSLPQGDWRPQTTETYMSRRSTEHLDSGSFNMGDAETSQRRWAQSSRAHLVCDPLEDDTHLRVNHDNEADSELGVGASRGASASTRKAACDHTDAGGGVEQADDVQKAARDAHIMGDSARKKASGENWALVLKKSNLSAAGLNATQDKNSSGKSTTANREAVDMQMIYTSRYGRFPFPTSCD